jgi:hypothetical protein
MNETRVRELLTTARKYLQAAWDEWDRTVEEMDDGTGIDERHELTHILAEVDAILTEPPTSAPKP